MPKHVGPMFRWQNRDREWECSSSDFQREPLRELRGWGRSSNLSSLRQRFLYKLLLNLDTNITFDFPS